jgi:hypothetical protein
MANYLRGWGLRWLYSLNGGPCITRLMQKDASQATAIFRGDVVAREADRNLAPGGTPGTTLYDGVASEYGAALTLTDHLVMVDPVSVFEAQSGATGLLAADEGMNANFIFSAGDTGLGKSGHLINDATEDTTNTLDVHLKEFIRSADNEDGPYARFGVLINKHRSHGGVAGV